MRREELSEATCSIAQALAVVGDAWSLLIVRDIAGGVHRFDGLQAELGISRRTLTERLRGLMAGGVLEQRLYSPAPPRHEYHLTEAGRGLLPVLVSLQDWGSRHVLGDGTLSATTAPGSVESGRLHGLVGSVVPTLRLPAHDGVSYNVAEAGSWTVLAAFPGATADPSSYPPGWQDIPGAPGCALEATTYRDLAADFAAAGVVVRALSMATPQQAAPWAERLGLTYPVLSDADGELVTALRLPTFHAGGRDHLKRLTLVLDPGRVVRAVQFPIADPAGSVREALAAVQKVATPASRPLR
ncbi:MAG TPA: winged helix-turn-helix transcriptional regulator [Marmoricola sp.]|nr:winged helix-turn-helix transcriptional regulator [Marmoricola sp.]